MQLCRYLIYSICQIALFYSYNNNYQFHENLTELNGRNAFFRNNSFCKVNQLSITYQNCTHFDYIVSFLNSTWHLFSDALQFFVAILKKTIFYLLSKITFLWFSDSSFRKQKCHQIKSATYFKNVWKAPFEKCEKPWRILVIIEVFISQMTFDFQAFLYVINVLGKWIVSIRLFCMCVFYQTAGSG